MIKFTKGPWVAEKDKENGLHYIWEDQNEMPTLIARTCYAPNSTANGHLIAAAPCLLKALQAFCDKCNEYNLEILAPEYEVAMTIIAKALNQNGGGE